MKISTITAAFLFVFSLAAHSQESAHSSLAGTWVIDLKPSPDAEPYLQEMAVEFIDEQRFAGNFYNTPFENGEINTAWDQVYFAFSTKAGKSVYYHAGYLEDGMLKGITYCDNRDFVMPWTGNKKEITN